MGYVKTLYIDGLKRFEHFKIEFNEHLSILVGENEAGKSTILEAIRIVLNQLYWNADKSVLQDLFNLENVRAFQNNPNVATLPRIMIEVDLELDNTPRFIDFYGENHVNGNRSEEKYGIRFECKFDEDFSEELADSINDGKIPYEYYSLTWQTYANLPYKVAKRPIKNLFIDTSETSKSSAFNYFNRALFSNLYSNDTKLKAKNAFREKLSTSFEDVNLPDIDDRRRFGIDNKKVVLESVVSVYEDSIPLENKGSGMESLVKTQIALNREDDLDTILIEEPENHLCFTNLKQMLQQIMDHEEDSQIILTTHSNMIASRLNLRNVIWIAENHYLSLKNIEPRTSIFFEKADDKASSTFRFSSSTARFFFTTSIFSLVTVIESSFCRNSRRFFFSSKSPSGSSGSSGNGRSVSFNVQYDWYFAHFSEKALRFDSYTAFSSLKP